MTLEDFLVLLVAELGDEPFAIFGDDDLAARVEELLEAAKGMVH